MQSFKIETSTRQPFDLSDEVAARVKKLGLQANLDQMRDEGYTIVPNIASREWIARLRETCLQLAQETKGPGKGNSASLLLGRDPIFEEAVLNPKVQVLVEVMCGKGALLSQLIMSRRAKGGLGAFALPLHADNNWMPAPFPKHNSMLTMCWTMENFTKAGGATKVVPKSHLKGRHPSQEEMSAEVGAIATECPSGSIVCWDSSIWHGNWPRTIDGERVVLHMTFSRLMMRTVENYDHLDEKWLEGKPHELSIMLGREDFLGTATKATGSFDIMKLPNTFNWAKT